jgi:hypothetical protein
LVTAGSGTLKKDLQLIFSRFAAKARTGTPNFGQLPTHGSILG